MGGNAAGETMANEKRKTRWVPIFGAGYLFVMVAFFLGMHVAQARVWPFYIVRDIFRFVEGHLDENTSLFEKISNDLGIRPERYLYDYKIPHPKAFTVIKSLPWASRRGPALIKASGDAPKGYVYVVGKFDFKDGMNGVLLFDTRGKLLKRWIIPAGQIKRAHHHLFHIRRDGSIVSAPDYAPLYHLDRCSKRIGGIQGNFHHSIDPLDKDRYWITGPSRIRTRFPSSISRPTRSSARFC